MNGPDFDHFCQLVRGRSGIILTAEKAYLVESRLGPVARSTGLSGVDELLAKLRTGAPESLIQRCIEAMATHESFFFRDVTPFETLARVVLPELIARREQSRTIRIWCAACSSGQEPYSIAMVLRETAAHLAGWRFEIVATDFSEPIIAKARGGLYSDFEVRRGLSLERRDRWLRREGHNWRVTSELQQMVSFRHHNLLAGAQGVGRVDVVFCRNVLIYFDVGQKAKVLGEVRGVLADDGYLFLGSAETVIGVSSAFDLSPGARGLYQPARAMAKAN